MIVVMKGKRYNFDTAEADERVTYVLYIRHIQTRTNFN